MDNNWNSPKYLEDIFDFKSNRRTILINSINEFYNVDNEQLKLICEAFECLHFSVTTVDDIIDNETFRNDVPCYYVRKGYDTSVIASFSTFINFLNISSKIGQVNNEMITNLSLMLMSEEADIGLRKREHCNPIEWYSDVSCTKSSYEILTILNLFETVKPNENFQKLNKLFFEIGIFAQMTNDTRDLINDNPLERYSTSDTVKLTYNLPLAIYINSIDDKIEDKIGNNISRTEFLEIHQKLNSNYITKSIISILHNQHEKINALLNTNKELEKSGTIKLVHQIANLEFYKKLNQYEILSK